MMNLNNPIQFYNDPDVRRCKLEYLGSEYRLERGWPILITPGCDYLTIKGKAVPEIRKMFGKDDGRTRMSIPNVGNALDFSSRKGLEEFRSAFPAPEEEKRGVWTLADVEFNSKYERKVYDDAWGVYNRMEEFYNSFRTYLDRNKIDHSVKVTGQGYHFEFFVPLGTRSHELLQEVGYIPDTLEGKYNYIKPGGRRDRKVPLADGLGFDGGGRIVAHMFYELMKENPAPGGLPLVLCDTLPGITSKNMDRDCIVLDWSWYTDPLYMRVARILFSMHYKSERPIITVPRLFNDRKGEQVELALAEVFGARYNFNEAAKLARRVDGHIAIGAGEGLENLIGAYLETDLRKFHQDFDQTPQEPWQNWPSTYDPFSYMGELLPGCVRETINNPNPRMLEPPNLQKLIITMLSVGWHPAHIAGFIRSKYERDYGWSENQSADWNKYDANLRARKWVELYVGAIVSGAHDQANQNCVSAGEEQLCFDPDCGINLANNKWDVKAYISEISCSA